MALTQTDTTINILVSSPTRNKVFKFDKWATVRYGSASQGQYYKFYEPQNNDTNKVRLSEAEFDKLLGLDADKNGIIEKHDYELLKKNHSKYVDYDSCEGAGHLTIPVGKSEENKSFDVIF